MTEHMRASKQLKGALILLVPSPGNENSER